MDFVKNMTGGGGDNDNSKKGDSSDQQKSSESGGGGGFLSGIGNKLNAAAGGGPESEKNEDYLDKGEFLQEMEEIIFLYQPWCFVTTLI